MTGGPGTLRIVSNVDSSHYFSYMSGVPPLPFLCEHRSGYHRPRAVSTTGFRRHKQAHRSICRTPLHEFSLYILGSFRPHTLSAGFILREVGPNLDRRAIYSVPLALRSSCNGLSRHKPSVIDSIGSLQAVRTTLSVISAVRKTNDDPPWTKIGAAFPQKRAAA
jgi:hypothetical protein